MSKTKKILYLILCILILTILIPILLDYHKVSGLGLHLVDWKQISFEYQLSQLGENLGEFTVNMEILEENIVQ